MIINFLRKIRTELLKEKLELEKKQNADQLKLDESTGVIQKLKYEEERSYDAFSPRKQNVELRDNIYHLEQEQKEIINSFQKTDNDLNHLNKKIMEIDSILKTAIKQKVDLEKLNTEKNINNDTKMIFDNYTSVYEKMKDILYKVEFSIKLIEIDPLRCKIELSSMVKEMNQIIEQLSEIGEIENETNKSSDS